MSRLEKVALEEDEGEYNPYKHRKLRHPNTFLGALMHILKSSLGTGILAMPRAVALAGAVTGIVGVVLTGILCAHTIHLLIFASQEICKKARIPSLSFAGTAEEVFKHGPRHLKSLSTFARIFVDVALLLTYFAACSVYVVFICESIRQLVLHYQPEASDWKIQYYMLILMVPLIFFCQIRQLKHLVPLSFIANITMIVAFGITLYYMFDGIADIKIEEIKMANKFENLPQFFSTVLFAMEGIGSIFPVENTMVEKKFLGCPGVINVGMTFVTVLYSIIGLFGYLRFGDIVNPNIIANLPESEIAGSIAKACIATAVFLTFMLQFYVPCEIAWRNFGENVPQKYQNLAQILFRTFGVMFVILVAAVVPKLDSIIDLVGSIFFSILGLFIPAVVDIVFISGGNGNFGFLYYKLLKDLLIILLALFALFSGSYYAIKGLVE